MRRLAIAKERPEKRGIIKKLIAYLPLVAALLPGHDIATQKQAELDELQRNIECPYIRELTYDPEFRQLGKGMRSDRVIKLDGDQRMAATKMDFSTMGMHRTAEVLIGEDFFRAENDIKDIALRHECQHSMQQHKGIEIFGIRIDYINVGYMNRELLMIVLELHAYSIDMMTDSNSDRAFEGAQEMFMRYYEGLLEIEDKIDNLGNFGVDPKIAEESKRIHQRFKEALAQPYAAAKSMRSQ